MEVLKILSQFVFATREQLVRLLEIKGIDPSTLDDDLSLMLENRQVNCFYLAETASPEFEPAEDAFLVYCMDFGALCLLNHFSSSDSLSWFTTDANRSSELVLKYLTTVEFFCPWPRCKGPSRATSNRPSMWLSGTGRFAFPEPLKSRIPTARTIRSCWRRSAILTFR